MPYNVQSLSSSTNPRLRAAIRLRDGRQRRKQQRFLVDGTRDLSRALQAGYVPQEIYFAGELQPWIDQIYLWAGDEAETVSRALRETNFFQLPANLIASLAYGQRQDDIVGVLMSPGSLRDLPKAIDSIDLSPNSLVVVLDRIEKPGNIGAIFRTADAVGVDAIMLSDCPSDLYNSNTIRASSGSVFKVPNAHGDAATIKRFLTDRKFRVLSTVVDATENFWSVDWKGAVALVIGNESSGVSAIWREEGTMGIHIPMKGLADSLNASITAAVCLYEAARQRAGS